VVRRAEPITVGFVIVPAALLLFPSTRLVGAVLAVCSIVILALRGLHRRRNRLAEQAFSTQWRVEDPAVAGADAIPLAAELLAVVTRPAGLIGSKPSPADSWLATNSVRVNAVGNAAVAFGLSVISATLLDAAGAFALDEPLWASFRDRLAQDLRFEWRRVHRHGAYALAQRCSELLDRLRETPSGLVLARPAIGAGYVHNPLMVAIATAAVLVGRQDVRDAEGLARLSRAHLDALT
jgi:hypothetical protein